MDNMFKDWSFWKPIVKYVSAMIFYFTFLYVLPQNLALIVSLSGAAIMVIYLLYTMGKAQYDYKQAIIKRNYQKLTGKDIDE